MTENLINWNESYSVGNTEMDEQHKKLIETINNFFETFKKGEADEQIFLILDEMVNYSIYHLNSEEKFLEKINYTTVNEHVAIHEDYKQKIAEFRHKARSKKEGIHYEIFDYLKNWWTNHILIEDMKYKKFLKDI